MKKLFVFFSLSLLTLGNSAFAQMSSAATETPWAWYISRSSALLAFAMLYLTILFGLSIRITFLRKLFSPVYSMEAHKWLSVNALLFAFIHGTALTFDHYLNFKLKDVFIPFASSYQPYLVGLGVVAFYLMLLLIVSSYGKKYLSQSVWRAMHSLNIGLYIAAIFHALYLGTDLKRGDLREFFIWANVVLMILFAYNIYLRMALAWKIKNRRSNKA